MKAVFSWLHFKAVRVLTCGPWGSAVSIWCVRAGPSSRSFAHTFRARGGFLDHNRERCAARQGLSLSQTHFSIMHREGKGREGKGREGKGREGKGREERGGEGK